MFKEKSEDKEKLQRFKEDLEDLQWYVEEFTFFTPIAVCGTTSIGIITLINKSFQELTGYKEIDIIGESLEIIFSEKEKVKKIIQNLSKKETIEGEELTLISREKKETPVSINVGARKDKEGSIIGYFISIADITESKKFQEELERKVQERTRDLKKKLEELEEFHRLTVGRELEMMELKAEIQRLKEEIERVKAKDERILPL